MAKQLILGSNSPRRQEILSLAGYRFEVVVSHEEERANTSLGVYEIPKDLARQKAGHILPTIQLDDFFMITSDTVVILEGNVIGKPIDLEDARDILGRLSGKTHEVVSGVCVSNKSGSRCFSDLTKVHFAALSDEEIEHYIKHYEVMDKAGAYAIQEGIGLTSVESIKGSYYNVMGLPIHKVYKELTERGIYRKTLVRT